MRFINPPLINHAPRMGTEGKSFALSAVRHDAPVTLCARDTVDVDGGDPGDRASRSISGSSELVESPDYIERMLPPIRPVVSATEPSETGLVLSEQVFPRLVVPGELSGGPYCLHRFAQVLHRRHGISNDAALAIALAAVSAAVGTGRTLRNPLGGTVSTSLNVIVEDRVNACLRRAACQALNPFQQQVERKIAAHQEKGAKHLRQLRMEMEQECARAVSLLHSTPEKVPQPLTIPVPADERKKDALKDAVMEAEQTAERLRHFEFEERPFLVVDGLAAKDISAITQRTFDGALLNFSPGGDGLRQFDALRPAERREVLRYLVAAWHGKAFVTGNQNTLNPSVTNLWLLGAGEANRAWRTPTIATSGLLETFFVVANDTPAIVDPESFTTTAADDDWRDLINVALGERIMGDACEHQLCEGAAQCFLQFHADTVQDQRADTRKLTAWWPEQVLKVALLLHLDSVHEEPSNEISLTTLEAAISIVERLGAAQLRGIAATNSPQDHVDTEIEVMVAKSASTDRCPSGISSGATMRNAPK